LCCGIGKMVARGVRLGSIAEAFVGFRILH